MKQDEIRKLLDQHRSAYRLLLWLDEKAAHDPEVFSQTTIAALKDSALCITWIEKHRPSMPQELLPDSNQLSNFANMLSSFFETSFHIKIQEFNSKVLEARLCRTRNPSSIQKPTRQIRLMMINAVRQLASNEGITIDQEIARQVVGRIDLRNDLWLWLYVFELKRRSDGKTNGNVDHTIWKAISPDVRRSLDVDVVWDARSRLVAEIQRVKNKYH